VRQREARTGKEISLAALSATIANGRVFVGCLDTFGYDQRAELETQAHRRGDELLLTPFAIEAFDEVSIELDDAGLQVRYVLQIGVPGAEVVHHQVCTDSAADFAQNAEAQVEVREGRCLRDLQIDVMVVSDDGIVGSHQPALFELARVKVDEERYATAHRHCDLTDGAPKSTRRVLGQRVLEEHGGREARDAASHESLVREKLARIESNDRLKDDREIARLHETPKEARFVFGESSASAWCVGESVRGRGTRIGFAHGQPYKSALVQAVAQKTTVPLSAPKPSPQARSRHTSLRYV
jgi:hypothetical protein